ncbi:MAG: TIGR03960 family B12-binding radical SAM protein [Clostridia bacterium]|nr:MAG: TIGR03960 family B12-binding radical SAM protein [Clostridia bacterium]
MEPFWEEVLSRVERPSRYLGTEYNSIHKDWDKAKVRMAFVFPDLYEVGMSHLGLAILYGQVNDNPDWLLERVFAPGPDMARLLAEGGQPLFSLESHRPLGDFDVVGITLPYELCYTTILAVLAMGHIPPEAEKRYGHPLVIGGGPGTANPEPLAPFFDAFVLGDGEEVLVEILGVVSAWKEEGGDSRQELLFRLARLTGVYVPSFYRVTYLPDGRVRGVEPEREGVPAQVTRRVLPDLDRGYFPTRPIVPFGEVIHDRAMLEVMRGCTRGCRFCQAGIFYRPVRERSPEVLKQKARELLEHTGQEEISLVSLSTADYSQAEPLCRDLLATYAGQRVNVSLPSLRADSFGVRLAELVRQVRRGGITLAPEAGTQRLRDVINKGVTEEDLYQAVEAAFSAGWDRVKLYFMIGLPTETQEDLQGLVETAYQVLHLGRQHARRAQVTVSVSTFVPKPGTPFQWEPQEAQEVLREKQAFLRARLGRKGINFSWHDPGSSLVEAVLALGDRRLGRALKLAWQRGFYLETWSERFDFAGWMAVMTASGLDPSFYAHRRRPDDEVLPWEHLDLGVTRAFLRREHRRALAGEFTPDCRWNRCPGCGVCPRLDVDLRLATGDGPGD